MRPGDRAAGSGCVHPAPGCRQRVDGWHPATGLGAGAAGAEERNDRRTVQGVVQSIKMKKTITVLWARQVKHPRYGKIMQRNTKLHAHDETNQSKIGDKVSISETRPVAKTKSWALVEILERAVEV